MLRRNINSLIFTLALGLAAGGVSSAAEVGTRPAPPPPEQQGRELQLKLQELKKMLPEKFDLTDEEYKTPETFLAALKVKYPVLYTYLTNMNAQNPERFRRAYFMLKQLDQSPAAKSGGQTAGLQTPGLSGQGSLEARIEATRTEMRALVEKYRQADGEEKARLEAEVRQKVAAAFDLTTESRKTLVEESARRLEEAQKKLARAKDQLNGRIKNRDKYIDTFMTRVESDKPLPELEQSNPANDENAILPPPGPSGHFAPPGSGTVKAETQKKNQAK